MNRGADFAVIIPAAGRSARYGSDKLAQIVGGRSVLEHSVRAFIDRDDVAAIVIAARDPAAPLPLDRSIAAHPKLAVCAGGEHRAQSVQRALARLLEMAVQPPEMLGIHDAARPAVSQALIDRVFAAARQHGAAVPALPVSDTIKRVRDRVIMQTLPRSELVAVQTPQAMRRQWLVEALQATPLPADQITDDAQLLEAAGHPVRIVEGEADNLKLTHAQDVERVMQLLSSRTG